MIAIVLMEKLPSRLRKTGICAEKWVNGLVLKFIYRFPYDSPQHI